MKTALIARCRAGSCRKILATIPIISTTTIPAISIPPRERTYLCGWSAHTQSSRRTPTPFRPVPELTVTHSSRQVGVCIGPRIYPRKPAKANAEIWSAYSPFCRSGTSKPYIPTSVRNFNRPGDGSISTVLAEAAHENAWQSGDTRLVTVVWRTAKHPNSRN